MKSVEHVFRSCSLYSFRLCSLSDNIILSLPKGFGDPMKPSELTSFWFELTKWYCSARFTKKYALHRDILLGMLRRFVWWIIITKSCKYVRPMNILVWLVLDKTYILFDAYNLFAVFQNICNVLVIFMDVFIPKETSVSRNPLLLWAHSLEMVNWRCIELCDPFLE